MIKQIFICPSLRRDCSWEGVITDIETHFEDFHTDLLLTDNTNIILHSSEEPLNRILIHDGEVFLIQTEYCEDSNVIFLRIRQPGPPNDVKYHVDVRSTKNMNYLFSSKDSVPGYNTIKVANSAIEIDVGSIQMIAGVGNMTASIVFENIVKPVVRREEKKRCTLKREHALLQKNHSFTATNSLDGLSRLFRTYSTMDESARYSIDIENILDGIEEGNTTDENEFKKDVASYLNYVQRISNNNAATSCEDVIDNSRHQIKEEQAKLEMIQCTNCARYMNPPIFVCLRGHSVCFYCQDDTCHKCGVRITDLPNSDLEEISRSILHPCRFAAQGCDRVLHYTKIHPHEVRCQFHLYMCVDVLRCSLMPDRYRFSELNSHIRVMHPSVRVFRESLKIAFTKGSEFFIVCEETGIFYCTTKMEGDALHWMVQFCGAPDTYFACQLRISTKKVTSGAGGIEKMYYLTRKGMVWTYTMTLKELKSSKLKEKTAELHISAQ